MIRNLAALTVLTLIAPLGTAQSSSDLPYALRRAIEAGPKLKYTGKRRVEFRRDGRTEAFTELVSRDGSRMRIEFPSGSTYSGQIIVENNGERKHFFPDKNEIHVSRARREEAFDRLVKLARTDKYKLSVGPEEVIAGIAADHIVVSDRNGNVAQRLFIDPRSGMLLKRKLFDPVGTQVGFFEFQTIDLTPNFPANVFSLTRKGARILKPVDLMKRIAVENGFASMYVKASSGYNLAFSKLNTIEGRDVLMQFYSSEKGRLSLFQTKVDVSQNELKKFKRGDLNAYSWKSRGKTFVLIGGLDDAALKRLSGQVAAY